MARKPLLRTLPLQDRLGRPFRYGIPDPVTERLQRIDRELTERGERMRRAEAQNLASFREKTGEPMPRVLLVVDEFQEFFSEEVIGAFTFKLGFTIRFNSFEFGLSIINESIGKKSSAPWHLLIQLMTNWEKQGGVVAFRNYEDLEGILNHFVNICQNIKSDLLSTPS